MTSDVAVSRLEAVRRLRFVVLGRAVAVKPNTLRQVSNPVILVDEVDKLGRDFRLTPSGLGFRV